MLLRLLSCLLFTSLSLKRSCRISCNCQNSVWGFLPMNTALIASMLHWLTNAESLVGAGSGKWATKAVWPPMLCPSWWEDLWCHVKGLVAVLLPWDNMDNVITGELMKTWCTLHYHCLNFLSKTFTIIKWLTKLMGWRDPSATMPILFCLTCWWGQHPLSSKPIKTSVFIWLSFCWLFDFVSLAGFGSSLFSGPPSSGLEAVPGLAKSVLRYTGQDYSRRA